MITEDYCSFNVSKLLKEKGFNDPFTHMFINKNNVKFDCSSTGVVTKETIACPTHQIAMKWLREVHKIGIFPSTYTFMNLGGTEEYHHYGTAIINLVTYELMTDDIMSRSSYEEAVEAALKYTLENLI